MDHRREIVGISVHKTTFDAVEGVHTLRKPTCDAVKGALTLRNYVRRASMVHLRHKKLAATRESNAVVTTLAVP